MISFFANLFGYILNFLYKIVGNFGFAIILFSFLVKLIMLPISIKQQKTMKKTQKLNEEMKQIQFKYKNDPEKLNQEIMSLYKREKLNPFSGCFSAIVQLILLLSVFYLVRSPLTYMYKVDPVIIENLQAIIQEQGSASNYQEIAIINYINNLKNTNSVSEEQSQEELAEQENTENSDTENQDNDFNVYDYVDDLYINMDFLGIDLSKVPTENLTDWKTLIIPILYVISSFISIRMSSNTTSKNKKEKNLLGDGTETETQKEYDAIADANKSMMWFMPLMSISIACIAPLGLALYWLVNNILMMLERLVLNKFLKDDKEEAKNNA